MLLWCVYICHCDVQCCDDVVLWCVDALTLDVSGTTGNGGRSWKSRLWRISGNNGTAFSDTLLAPILTILEDATVTSFGTPIVITTMEVGTYDFSLTVMNFLGKEATSSTTVTKELTEGMPTVSILGPSR